MSYLDVPRLHFCGRFVTTPSTVNNISQNFSTRLPAPETINNPQNWNWNPFGGHRFQLYECSIVRVVHADGGVVTTSSEDRVIGLPLQGTDDPVPAKMADLDTEQQYVPSIYGLTLRLGAPGHTLGCQGAMVPTPLNDTWRRAPVIPGTQEGGSRSGWYQSVLNELQWSASGSPALEQLARVSPDRISIRFVLDGYDMDSESSTFQTGRVVGTLGPAAADEPISFVPGRLLRPPNFPFGNSGENLFDGNPAYFAPFRVDERRRRLLLDLGNALPTTGYGGPIRDLGSLHPVVLSRDSAPIVLPALEVLGGAYEQDAGVAEVPLDAESLATLSNAPLRLMTLTSQGELGQTILQEDSEGRMLRADPFTLRMEPEDNTTVRIHAFRFGRPAPGEKIDLKLTAERLRNEGQVVPMPRQQDGDALTDPTEALEAYLSGMPAALLAKQGVELVPIPIAEPAEALRFPEDVTTDEAGVAAFELKASDPKRPRLEGAIDGQVYPIAIAWEGLENPCLQHFVSVRVFDRYPMPDAPTWADAKPILEPYAKLFPYMRHLVDLGHFATTHGAREQILRVLSYPESDPRYMPVTRDLSASKRALLIAWLERGALK
ncbi:MAG: hypothetical protein KUG77_15640 [Nannocystaceae bacterium]|nr:hypothetical protein [Nannocystaceae bacterium]